MRGADFRALLRGSGTSVNEEARLALINIFLLMNLEAGLNDKASANRSVASK